MRSPFDGLHVIHVIDNQTYPIKHILEPFRRIIGRGLDQINLIAPASFEKSIPRKTSNLIEIILHLIGP